MGLGPIHCGSFLLLVAFVLLLVATISAPVIHDISFLNVNDGNSKSTFGVFGYCLNVNANNNQCSGSGVGYDLTAASGARLDHQWTNNTLNRLTDALILHPIALGLTLFAAIIALCADRVGFICASFIAFLAFVVSLVAMIFDFVIFGIVKHEINDKTTGSADFSTAIWLVLAATIVLFFSVFIVLFECCTQGRRKKRDYDSSYNNGGYVGNAQPDMGYAGTSRPWYSRMLNRNKY